MKTCPKCEHTSGNDWSQCGTSCPMSMSPKHKKKKIKESISPTVFRIEKGEAMRTFDQDTWEWMNNDDDYI